MELEAFAQAWKQANQPQSVFVQTYGISVRTCQRLLAKARAAGFLDKIDSYFSHGPEKEAEVKDIYLAGNGVLRTAKITGLPEPTVYTMLQRLGVRLRTEQASQPSGKKRRQRRLKSQEFTDATKRACYERERGICQECSTPVGGGYRAGTYHHIRLCRDGGGPELDNCMLLHGACHNHPDIFRRLHGFDITHLENYASA